MILLFQNFGLSSILWIYNSLCFKMALYQILTNILKWVSLSS